MIEDDIMDNRLSSEDQVPSTTELSKTYQINPATVRKGLQSLVDDGLIYKKRGIGMFVTSEAKKILQKRRQETFYLDYVDPMFEEAKRLGITKIELIENLKKRGEE